MRASRSRVLGVKAAFGWLAWSTKASGRLERFLDSSTPRPEAFPIQDQSDRVVTLSWPTSLDSSANASGSPWSSPNRPPPAHLVRWPHTLPGL